MKKIIFILGIFILVSLTSCVTYNTCGEGPYNLNKVESPAYKYVTYEDKINTTTYRYMESCGERRINIETPCNSIIEENRNEDIHLIIAIQIVLCSLIMVSPLVS